MVSPRSYNRNKRKEKKKKKKLQGEKASTDNILQWKQDPTTEIRDQPN